MTFDKVPSQSDFTGLDYSAIAQVPARGVIVQAVDGSGTELDRDITDASGNYSVDVNSSTNVRIQVRSQLEQTTGASWDISVVDNTSSNAIYILQGTLADSGTANSTRDLNAASGWGGASYTSTRAAAPFNILDAIYEAVSGIAIVDPNVSFPTLQVFWSVNNVPVSGDVTQGQIGTSSYTRTNGVPTIRILGDENNDTDEYDDHVIVHEFGHYFEDQLSRSDSPGGSHSLSNRLDSRLAFGEGWGNAFAGMILGDPNYRDSGGSGQATGFTFSVETDLTSSAGPRVPGWFNEATTQQLLYDLFDSADDGADTISGGLGPLYNAFTDPAYRDAVNFTTIFEFANRVRNEAGINASTFDAMLAAEDINTTDPRGVGETNDGGLPQILPIYKVATVGGAAVNVCSTATNGDTNKHGVREFITVTLPSTGAVTMTATETSGPATTTDPDFIIWERGSVFTNDSRNQDRRAFSSADGSESWTGTLDAGTYAIEIYDCNNAECGGAAAGDSCFDFTVN
ncbi:MAG: hypothetical protein NXH78_15625 [Hyphomonadaceae bacterium]|nr:hypothetical protein [Hyphomonadaceae bacterium]